MKIINRVCTHSQTHEYMERIQNNNFDGYKERETFEIIMTFMKQTFYDSGNFAATPICVLKRNKIRMETL